MQGAEFGAAWHGLQPATGKFDLYSQALTVKLADDFIMTFSYRAGSNTWVYDSAYPQLVKPTLVANFEAPSSGEAAWQTLLATTQVSWTLRFSDGKVLTLATSPALTTGDTPKPVVVTSQALPNGFSTNYTYTVVPDSPTSSTTTGLQLSTITGADGRVLHLTWAGWSISRIDLPDGGFLRYTYDAPNGGTIVQDRLLKAERVLADGATVAWSQAYVYEDGTQPYALTGVFDALGNRRTKDAYNSLAQVTQTGRADGSETLTITYPYVVNGDTSTTHDVTNLLGKVQHYQFGINQVGPYPQITGVRFSGIAEDASSLSPARAMTYNYSGGNSASTVTTATDSRGTPTNLTYDGLNRPAAVTLAAGTSVERTETTAWHPTLDRPTHEVQPGKTIDYVYDGVGRLLSRTETDTTTNSAPYSTAGQTRTWTYSWTGLGKLASMQGPKAPDAAGHADLTSYTYDSSGNLLTVQNGLGYVTSFSNYDANGRPGRMTAASGTVTDFTYDPIGRLVTRTVRDPLDSSQNAVTTLSYDLEGQLIALAPPATSPLYFDYSTVGRLMAVRDVSGARIDYRYDQLGNRIQDKTSRPDGTIRQTVTRSFDDLGRMLSETLGPGRTRSFGYDANDNPVQLVNARSQATVLAFDPLDRLAGTIDAMGGQSLDQHDGQDNAVQHTDRIKVATTYVRDGFGDIIQETSPDRGTTVNVYDAAGDVISSTDGRGQTVGYVRNILGRIITKSPNGANGQNINYSYDTTYIGKLASIIDGSGSTVYVYDNRGNIIAKQIDFATTTAGTYTVNVGYAYDPADRIVQVTYPSGNVVSYARDALGRVTAITLVSNGGTSTGPPARAMDYDAFGPLTSAMLGNGTMITQDWGSDARLYAKSLTGPNGDALWSKTYAYDGDDNIVAVPDLVNPAKSAAYSYDALSRLTRATGSFGDHAREDYAYDANDNRLQLQKRTLGGDPAAAITVVSTLTSGTNQLASVFDGSNTRTFTYDARGNLASETRFAAAVSTTYDAFARLSSYSRTGTPTFNMVYNGLDQRVQVTAGPTATRYFVYDESGRLISESAPAANGIAATFAEHVWLSPDVGGIEGYQPLALVGSSNTTWVTGDHLGTPVLLTGAAGTVVHASDTTPFGERWASQAASPTTAEAFPGQLIDIDDRFYNAHRDYDPTLGRYLQADPIGLSGGENIFGYARSSPITHIDFAGLQAFPIPSIAPLPPLPSGQQIQDWSTLISKITKNILEQSSTTNESQTPSDKICKPGKPCPPCKTASGRVVPVGTIGYRPLDNPNGRQHGIDGPHHNTLRANQNPNNCQCFWRPIGAVPEGQLPPGSIPVEPFVQ